MLRVPEVLRELERDVEDDPFGELHLGGRIRLWVAMRDEFGKPEANLRWSVLAYLVAREAAAGWDPRAVPAREDFAADFRDFPGRHLEAVRRSLLGEIPLADALELFDPLFGYLDWPEIYNNPGYGELCSLHELLAGSDEEAYEEEYFEVAAREGGEYREIRSGDEYKDVHEIASIGASGPGYGEDRGGPAEIVPRRAFWLRWLRETVPRVLGPRESVLANLRQPAGDTGR